MKSTAFIPILLFSLLFARPVSACGPSIYYAPYRIPFFPTEGIAKAQEKRENLLLWQKQTSPGIPLEDIEAVIYGDLEPDGDRGRLKTNRFLKFLYERHDKEAIDFIKLAKHIEKLRADRNSPWYYPKDKSDYNAGFEPVIAVILGYKGTRFRDRYSLQLIRALFASARYEECMEAFDERFDSVKRAEPSLLELCRGAKTCLEILPQDNLMRRMAEEYVAGAALRTGNRQAAIEHFASIGDISSLVSCMDKPEALGQAPELIAGTNTGSPYLLDYIARDFSLSMLVPIAENMLRKKTVADHTPWLYIMAIGCGEQKPKDLNKAIVYLNQALLLAADHPWRDYMRAYRMRLLVQSGNTDFLLSDLKWLESKVAEKPENNNLQWVRITQSFVFQEVIPHYLHKGDTIKALQLANYADNMPVKYQNVCWRYYTSALNATASNIPLARKLATFWNPHDYSNVFFHLLNRQSPGMIERYIASLHSSESLSAYLNSRGYTYPDYLWDVAGTVALRRQDYPAAIKYLSKVGSGYQNFLNVAKGGYLNRDPFSYHNDKIIRADHLKLRFAKEMQRLKETISVSRDPNERADAKLAYTTGLYNSFHHCWALTGYSQGFLWDMDYAPDYLREAGDRPSEEVWRYPNDPDDESKRLIEEALSEYTDKERLAEVYLMFCRYKDIAQKCPETKIAAYVRANCDHYKDWVARSL
ncbi:MAG: hypothetical protein NC396_06645 [Bacteroides sp.]|nr:hypothetical protein [Bacteroides sp.]MCM1086035.1 hypothetical protein [Bacteroides sp.]